MADNKLFITVKLTWTGTDLCCAELYISTWQSCQCCHKHILVLTGEWSAVFSHKCPFAHRYKLGVVYFPEYPMKTERQQCQQISAWPGLGLCAKTQLELRLMLCYSGFPAVKGHNITCAIPFYTLVLCPVNGILINTLWNQSLILNEVYLHSCSTFIIKKIQFQISSRYFLCSQSDPLPFAICSSRVWLHLALHSAVKH